MSQVSSHWSSLSLSLSLLLLCGAAVPIACGSTSNPAVDGGVGVVTGAVDNHCSGTTPIMVSPTSCHPPADAGAPPEDAGASDDGGVEPPPPIQYNAESDDDDCKYHVKFSTTPVLKNQNVTFTVTVTKLAQNNAPATNADVIIESFLANNELHPIPNNGTTTSESPANSGKYTVGPVKFDESGRWIVRFHLYGDCEDLLEDSPHSHVAFYYDVP